MIGIKLALYKSGDPTEAIDGEAFVLVVIFKDLSNGSNCMLILIVTI